MWKPNPFMMNQAAKIHLTTKHLRRLSWARLISNILSPPVIWGVLAFPIAFREAESREQAILWALTYTVLVCVMPAIYIARKVMRGEITDIHMRVRQQRVRPFLVSMLGTALAWSCLRLMGAPALLPLFALVSLAQLAVMLAITLFWQISLHSMSITSAVVATGVLYGPGAALILFPLIPVVGAARLKLRRHTLMQVIAGGVVGGALTLVLVLTAQY